MCSNEVFTVLPQQEKLILRLVRKPLALGHTDVIITHLGPKHGSAYIVCPRHMWFSMSIHTFPKCFIILLHIFGHLFDIATVKLVDDSRTTQESGHVGGGTAPQTPPSGSFAPSNSLFTPPTFVWGEGPLPYICIYIYTYTYMYIYIYNSYS